MFHANISNNTIGYESPGEPGRLTAMSRTYTGLMMHGHRIRKKINGYNRAISARARAGYSLLSSSLSR